MGRISQALRSLTVVAAAVALLAACGGQKAAVDPPTTHASAPTASSSQLVAPVMPESAKKHTRRGATAFVQYYWKVVNYSTVTFDTAPLKAIEAEGCDGCNRGLETIRSDAQAGVGVRGGAITPSAIDVKWQQAGGRKFAIASFTVSSEPELIDYPSPSADKSFAGGTSSLKLRLDPSQDGWYVTEWNPSA